MWPGRISERRAAIAVNVITHNRGEHLQRFSVCHAERSEASTRSDAAPGALAQLCYVAIPCIDS
jgi:hypothetical protein